MTNWKAEGLAIPGAVLVATGLWIERPSLALIFIGAVLLLIGVRMAAKRGPNQ